jgi:hypothetical protein
VCLVALQFVTLLGRENGAVFDTLEDSSHEVRVLTNSAFNLDANPLPLFRVIQHNVDFIARHELLFEVRRESAKW